MNGVTKVEHETNLSDLRQNFLYKVYYVVIQYKISIKSVKIEKKIKRMEIMPIKMKIKIKNP